MNGPVSMADMDALERFFLDRNLIPDIATLSTTSTLPAFRGMGVQTALIGARLQAAVEAGFSLTTVMGRPGSSSERNIVRAGFQLAYTTVRMKKR